MRNCTLGRAGLDLTSSGLGSLAGNQVQPGPNSQNSHGVQAKTGRALQPRVHQVQVRSTLRK